MVTRAPVAAVRVSSGTKSMTFISNGRMDRSHGSGPMYGLDGEAGIAPADLCVPRLRASSFEGEQTNVDGGDGMARTARR